MATRPVVSTNVAFNATAATYGVDIPPGVRRVRLSPNQDCFVTIGNPLVAATAANGVLVRAAAPAEYFAVFPGDQISVIQSSSSGVLNITQMTAG